LTTTSASGGEPGTPFYTGRRPLDLAPLVRKRSIGETHHPIRVEHVAVTVSG
jgi:hypothetical protein